MSEPRYPFVVVEATPEESDEIASALFELGALGVEERDTTTFVRGVRSDKVTLLGSFGSLEDAKEALAAIAEAVPEGGARLEEVVGDAWRDAWKEHFRPFALTPDITVAPPWQARPEVPAGTMILELEPGRAFGTGLHASTSLVSEVLHASRDRLAGVELLDVGTGSGILSFVALIYGAARATAIDLDPDVIGVVRENAARNGLSDRIDARPGTADTITRAYPLVLANIEAHVLRPIAADLARVTEPSGTLVLSGILGPEHDDLVSVYTSLPRRLVHTETRRKVDASGETWVAIVFTAA